MWSQCFYISRSRCTLCFSWRTSLSRRWRNTNRDWTKSTRLWCRTFSENSNNSSRNMTRRSTGRYASRLGGYDKPQQSCLSDFCKPCTVMFGRFSKPWQSFLGGFFKKVSHAWMILTVMLGDSLNLASHAWMILTVMFGWFSKPCKSRLGDFYRAHRLITLFVHNYFRLNVLR